MIKKLLVKQIPVIVGIDKDGRTIEADEWHGEVYAELDKNFVTRISLRCKNTHEDIVTAINKGLDVVIKDENTYCTFEEKGESDK